MPNKIDDITRDYIEKVLLCLGINTKSVFFVNGVFVGDSVDSVDSM